MGFRYWMAVLLGACAVLVGCGSGGDAKSAAPSPTAISAAFKGSPPALASLHAQADQLLSGGPAAFHARLATLRGYPVVVNKWASWCPPCRTEFPLFQQAAVRYGRQVAFIGVNGHQDTVPAATTFLKTFSVTYPSYEDPNEAIARTIQAATYDPMTVFIDRNGKIQYAKAGEYTSLAALEHDIKLYLLR
jgi:cytochrome c biogenesis protein CcmG, thiol:disulfide interchange protein DsbE